MAKTKKPAEPKGNPSSKKKKLNFKTLESPFDPDFEKITLDITEYDVFAGVFDRSCYDNDTCTDGPYGADD